MVALRIGKPSKFRTTPHDRHRDREITAGFTGEIAKPSRPVLTLDAVPMDVWQQARIEPPVSIAVHQITSDGLEARSESPLLPGRRVSLGFPDSPFLPRPGTVARVAQCNPVGDGWQIHLTYEPSHAA